MKTSRGMALITALLIGVLLLILGVAFLSYLENDYRFAARQEKGFQAYYLALAGLEYQKTRTDILSPVASATDPTTKKVFVGDDYFEVKVYPDGRIESKGVVVMAALATGAVSAERTLVIEPGKPVREYKDSSQ